MKIIEYSVFRVQIKEYSVYRGEGGLHPHMVEAREMDFRHSRNLIKPDTSKTMLYDIKRNGK